jgi:SAM-dependent methyltransferase
MTTNTSTISSSRAPESRSDWKCPVCASGRVRVALSELYDDRYGFPGFFELRECLDCAHQFLAAAFSPDQLVHLYTDYYPRSSRALSTWQAHREIGPFLTWLNREQSAVFRWVPRNCKVLDVGCGFGESLGYHRSRGCEVQGVETDANIIRVADRFGFKVRVGVFRASDFPRDYFDCVTLDQVIEHTGEPVQLLVEAATVLRPGGTVLVGTPNARSWLARHLGRRWVHWHTPYHLQLFCRRSLLAAADAAELEVVWIRNISPPRWYGFQWLHLLSRPEPGRPSMFWRAGSAWPVGRLIVRKLISAGGRLGMNHVLAYAFDCCGQGDNLVCLLRKRG